tara:strand:+ start:1710 stop:2213 length:504 start_codon:yes stop_codon:yes gene_type:complete
MKKIILLFVFTAFLSCETKTVEVNTQVGKALYGDQNKLYAGNMDYAKTTIDVLKAYADGNFDLIMEKMADTVRFFPDKGGELVTLVNPFNDFLTSMQEPYDSLTRGAYNVTSISSGLEGSSTIISVPFTETRYLKDGSVEKERVFERFIFNSEGKIARVNKWTAQMN